jgi:hypothetical protein
MRPYSDFDSPTMPALVRSPPPSKRTKLLKLATNPAVDASILLSTTTTTSPTWSPEHLHLKPNVPLFQPLHTTTTSIKAKVPTAILQQLPTTAIVQAAMMQQQQQQQQQQQLPLAGSIDTKSAPTFTTFSIQTPQDVKSKTKLEQTVRNALKRLTVFNPNPKPKSTKTNWRAELSVLGAAAAVVSMPPPPLDVDDADGCLNSLLRAPRLYRFRALALRGTKGWSASSLLPRALPALENRAAVSQLVDEIGFSKDNPEMMMVVCAAPLPLVRRAIRCANPICRVNHSKLDHYNSVFCRDCGATAYCGEACRDAHHKQHVSNRAPTASGMPGPMPTGCRIASFRIAARVALLGLGSLSQTILNVRVLAGALCSMLAC